MASIQRGDDRQYMAHELTQRANVGQEISNGINSVFGAVQKANASKLASNQIDLSNKYMMKVDEINNKYQADPTSEDRQRELKESFDLLAGQYKVNPLVQGQWNEIKNNVFNQYKQYDGKWQLAQQQSNAKNDFKNGYTDFINQGGMLGLNGANLDQIRMTYKNGYDALRSSAIYNLGEVDVDNALRNATHDFMASYFNGLIETNPAQAISMLDKEDVRNDIGDVKTIEQLQNSARSKMQKQVEIEAVDRVANLITTNNDVWSKAIDGTITTQEASNFLTNPDVDRNMKHILSKMLGYSTKSDLYVDGETGEILSHEAQSEAKARAKEMEDAEYNNGRYSSLVIGNKEWTFVNKKGQARNATDQEKREILNTLTLEGSQLLNGIEGKSPQQQMRMIAEYQSKVAQASYFGMSDSDYKNLMNTFVMPATQDIQAQAKNYRGTNRFNNVYGWQQIEKYFGEMEKNLGNKPSKKDLAEIENEKALASLYYWSGLNAYCSQNGISMDQLKNVESHKRGSIYNKYAQNAINQAKANSSNPTLWFRNANPQYVSEIRSSLPNSNANRVITNIAVATATTPNMSEKDFNAIVEREIQKEYASMRTQNRNVVFGGGIAKYDEYINLYANKYGVDPLLVKAVMKQESGGRNGLTSNKGAKGLMQLMPATAKELGVRDINDPRQNIEGGTKYLAQMLKKYNGNTQLALAAYNAGPGNVAKAGNKIPNIPATQNYVKNIMYNYNRARG